MVKLDGVTVRRLRERRMLTIRELAEQARVSWTTIFRLESGKFGGEVRPSTGRKIAEALGVEPGELIAREDQS